jgi:hypothetical protein
MWRVSVICDRSQCSAMAYLYEGMNEREDPQCRAKGRVPSLLRLLLRHLQEGWIVFIVIIQRYSKRLAFFGQMRS